eukprot:6195499-Pleurochrysis_carterae.AAC.1
MPRRNARYTNEAVIHFRRSSVKRFVGHIHGQLAVERCLTMSQIRGSQSCKINIQQSTPKQRLSQKGASEEE